MSVKINVEETCRICYDYDIIDNFIYPCKCSGNIKYVHTKCLITWCNSGNSERKKCEICLYEFVKKGGAIEFNPFLSKIRESFINSCLYILGIVMGYSTILYIIDRNLFIAKAFNIYGTILQDLRIYYYILFIPIFIKVCIYNTIEEVLQFDNKLKKEYLLLVLDKSILIIFITFILYYSLGWKYTNILTDYTFLNIIFIIILKRHIKSIDKINDELDGYENYEGLV
jgi:hypothetical protein